MRPSNSHAVVLGASMAGLAAARVLADAYDRVTVLDRDTLPAAGEHRRGVPRAATPTPCWPAGGPPSRSCSAA